MDEPNELDITIKRRAAELDRLHPLPELDTTDLRCLGSDLEHLDALADLEELRLIAHAAAALEAVNLAADLEDERIGLFGERVPHWTGSEWIEPDQEIPPC